METICIFCKHYYFLPGSPDYSEETSGWDTKEGCHKSYWETDMYNDDENVRRANFLKAKTCKDYIFFKE